MKITVRRKDLIEALQIASAILPRNGERFRKPILQCVWIADTSKVGVTISATNIDVAIHRTIDADVRGSGFALVECKPLLAMVRKLKGDTILLESDGVCKLHIRAVGASLSLPLQDAKEYPPIGVFEGEPAFGITAGDLQRMSRQTVYAAAREDSRYAINGVLIEAASRTVKMIATDGRRMAVSEDRMVRDIPVKAFTPVICPVGVVALLAKIKLPAHEIVDVGVWPLTPESKTRAIGFRAENLVIAATAVEGHFPVYADVIPRGNDKTATLPVDLLTAAIETVATATNEENGGIRFAFTADLLTLTVVRDGVLAATAAVPIRYSGPAADIGFNPCFILDALKACESETTVEFSWQADHRPGLFTGPNDTHVVMPCQLAARAAEALAA
jgi:DNA polymerase-3 subunit beta